MIGERIRWARVGARMSLRELAQRVGVSYEAIRKYEQGRLTPNSEMLLKLAYALGKPVDYFRPSAIQIGSIQPVFRGHARRAKREEKAIEAYIRDWLERYLTVEQILGKVAQFEYPEGFPRAVRSFEDVEQAAIDLRHAWELGLDPIANLTETLEEHGIRVGEVQGCNGFDACAFFVQNNKALPVIIVTKDAPGDRQRFSLAHELGHLMLHPEGTLDAESVANRFAGAFLAPQPIAKRELEGGICLSLLYALKHRYGMSMQAWIRRASDLCLLSMEEYAVWNRKVRKNGWHKSELGEQIPRERPSRFRRLVFEAYERELITASRASQLIGVPLQEFLREYAQLQGGEPIRAPGSG